MKNENEKRINYIYLWRTFKYFFTLKLIICKIKIKIFLFLSFYQKCLLYNIFL